MPAAPMAGENDRAWAIGVCMTLAFIVVVLLLVLG
jgi:hypothetical protein